MLRLLYDAGIIPNTALAAICCMRNAASRNALHLSDLDFYESEFETIGDELASFLLSKNARASNKGGALMVGRLLERNALLVPGAVFTFADTLTQCEEVHAVTALLSGLEANAQYWTQQFPVHWE